MGGKGELAASKDSECPAEGCFEVIVEMCFLLQGAVWWKRHVKEICGGSELIASP